MTVLSALIAALEHKISEPLCHSARSVAWHSAALIGERHELSLSFDNLSQAAALLEGLDEHPFDLRGHFVADIRAESSRRQDGRTVVRLEVLTLPSD